MPTAQTLEPRVIFFYMAKKQTTDNDYVMRKLRGGPYRPVSRQIERWRKRRKALGALKDSVSPREIRANDTRRNFFGIDEE